MSLVKRAEDLKQNLSLLGVLDIVIELAKMIEPKEEEKATSDVVGVKKIRR